MLKCIPMFRNSRCTLYLNVLIGLLFIYWLIKKFICPCEHNETNKDYMKTTLKIKLIMFPLSSQGGHGQGKQGIWFLLFLARQNTGNFDATQGHLWRHWGNILIVIINTKSMFFYKFKNCLALLSLVLLLTFEELLQFIPNCHYFHLFFKYNISAY